MVKKTILTFFLISINISIAQVSTEWVQRYDGGYGGDAGLDVEVDDSGNVYMTGNIHSSQTVLGFIGIKYNSLGQEQWKKIISGIQDRSGASVSVDSNYNVYFGGTQLLKYDQQGNLLWRNDSLGGVLLLQKNVLYCSLGETFFISRRLNEQTSNVLWTRIYPTIQYNYPNISWARCFDTQDNLIVSGRGRLSGIYNDYKTVKYSPSGDLIWERIHGDSGEDGSYAVTTDNSDNVYVTGWNGTSSTKILTIKYSPQGDTLWTSVFDAAGGDIGYDIEVDKYGYVYVGGVTHSSWYVTLKIDPAGNLIWSREQEGRGIPYFPILKLDSNRNVYMAYTSNRPGPYSNYAVVKYDNDGNQKWIAEYHNGGVTLNYIYDMEVDKNSNVYVTGKSGGGHGYSIATVKFVQNPVSIIHTDLNIPEKLYLHQNYPNPFNPSTRIDYDLPISGIVSLGIFDISGREIKTLVNGFNEAGSHYVEFTAADLPSGVYFCKLTSGNFVQTRRMMVLK